jgi:hypothetical protein
MEKLLRIERIVKALAAECLPAEIRFQTDHHGIRVRAASYGPTGELERVLKAAGIRVGSHRNDIDQVDELICS